ncbi:hypothetical protein [Sphingomonas sp. Leaf4]|uniref:hypothetical protein n=1 Tax=Sphingomonas sp. Leaf4 TaxID=2876553 RepID=UPI001E3C0241|nr:hypothetical protein [Sphingomonas sp. Leaf4]
MSSPPAADDGFVAAPLMVCVPAMVVRPDGFFIPPEAGSANVAFGASPAPDGKAMLCISIRHVDGTVLIAAIPEPLLADVTAAMKDATRQARTKRFAQPGRAQ